MRRKVMMMILMVFLLMQPFVYAEELSINVTSLTTKNVVYPNLGNEQSVDPSENFYYVVYTDAVTKKLVKTEEYRVADNRLMRIAYPDRSIKVIDNSPLSESKIKEYSDKYGFVPKKKVEEVVEEPYVTVLKSLLKDEKIKFFVNTYIKVGYYFDVDNRTSELISLITGLNSEDLKANPFSKADMKEIKDINKIVRRLSKIDGVLEVMIVPYAHKDYLKGMTFELNGGKIILLFNNYHVSLKSQFNNQLPNFIKNTID